MITVSAEMADRVRQLFELGYTWRDISWWTDLPRDVCQQIVSGPPWPKLVTQIKEDGSAQMVRYT